MRRLKSAVGPLRHRQFAIYVAATMLSWFGDGLLYVALPFYVYSRTHSTLQTGLTFFLETLPAIILQPVGGVFADRWDRRRLTLVFYLVGGPLVLPLLVLNAGDIWIAYAVAFTFAAVVQFVGPAVQALRRSLVPDEELVQAGAVTSTLSSVIGLAAPPLGGVLYAVVGFQAVVVADAATFALAAALLLALPRSPAPGVATAERRPSWLRDLAGGWAALTSSRALMALLVVFAFGSAVDRLASVVFVPYVRGTLGLGPAAYGSVQASLAIGGLAGGLLLATPLGRLPGRALLMVALVVGAVGLLGLALAPPLGAVLGLSAVIGIAAAGTAAATTGLFQRAADPAVLGRVTGLMGALVSIASLAGIGLASGLTDRVGVQAILGAAAVGFIVMALLALFMLQSDAGPALTPAVEPAVD